MTTPPTALLELTILMPCLNEAETLAVCIDKAKGYLERSGVSGEVLIADNGSTDGSQQIAKEHGARVVDIPEKGYGSALIGGINAAHGTYVIMGDADDSYDFSSLDQFVERLRAGDELVMGNRFRGAIGPGAMPSRHKYLGNPVLSTIGRVLFKPAIKDFHCGLRGFNRESMLDLHLQKSGMESRVKRSSNRLLTGWVSAKCRPRLQKTAARGRRISAASETCGDTFASCSCSVRAGSS